MYTNEIIIVLFGLIYFAFIIYTRSKGNFEEYSVAGRSLGIFLIFATICATFVGPAMTLGLSSDGFKNGGFLFSIATFGGLGMIIAALFFAPRVRARFTESYSIGDIIGGNNSHNHKSVKIAVGIVSLWLMSSITVAMSYAGGELVNNVFGFSKIWSIVIITCIVMIYAFFGGIRATIQTDAFQFLNFVVLIPLLGGMIIFSEHFSWAAYTDYASKTATQAFDAQTASALIGMYIFWLLSNSGLDAPVLNRFLASKNVRVAQTATFFAGIFICFWIALMVFIGSAGAYLHPNLEANDQVLLHIAEIYFPGILYGVFMVAMIGVVMSTQDTAMNTAGVILSEDIMAGLFPSLSDQRKLYYSKAFTIILGLMSIMIAGFLQSILHTLIVIFSFYIPVMIPVTLFTLFKNKHHWQSALAAMITGFATYVFWETYAHELAPATLIGVLCSCLVYWITDLLVASKN